MNTMIRLTFPVITLITLMVGMKTRTLDLCPPTTPITLNEFPNDFGVIQHISQNYSSFTHAPTLPTEA